MNVIHKFPIFLGTQLLMLPQGSNVLAVGSQGPQLVLWALANPSAPLEQIKVTVVWTGQPVREDAGRFIGTVATDDGLVWHVFVSETAGAAQ